MTHPERIQVILGPDDQPTIVNPVRRGAAIDWKATAQLMGRQILEDKVIREEQFKTIRNIYNRETDTHQALLRIRDHWTFKFKPNWLKTMVNERIEA